MFPEGTPPCRECAAERPKAPLQCFTLGVDLGQAKDFTAIAIVERKPDEYPLRHLERLPLGTGYPEIVEYVGELMKEPEVVGRIQLVVDATGVGPPVVDYFRRADLAPTAVTITGGNQTTNDPLRPSCWNVPKRDLVFGVVAMLQSGKLPISTHIRQKEILVQEMVNFKVKVSSSGHDSYEAWREGQHDDMVLAVCLAVWKAQRWGADDQVRVIPKPAGAPAARGLRW